MEAIKKLLGLIKFSKVAGYNWKFKFNLTVLLKIVSKM